MHDFALMTRAVLTLHGQPDTYKFGQLLAKVIPESKFFSRRVGTPMQIGSVRNCIDTPCYAMHPAPALAIDLCCNQPTSSLYLQGFELKTIVKQAAEKGFSDLIVINEDNKKPNALVICHLPDGPTAHYKLSRYRQHSLAFDPVHQTAHCGLLTRL
jgi:hypothetical protein